MHLLLLAVAAASAAPWPAGGDHPAPWTSTPSGLEVQDLVVGTGAAVEQGGLAIVHYTGMLADGTVFDSSRERGETFSFRVGEGAVIRGWEEGVLGMRVGGTRRLVIPPQLGYGARGVGPIPPDSVLFFEVELVDVVAPRRPPQAPETVPDDAWTVLRSGVRTADVALGDGAKARPEHRVCVDTATFDPQGALVAHTYTRSRCTWLRLGEDDLPPAVEEGILKMRAGGVRLVALPDGTVWRVAVENVGD